MQTSNVVRVRWKIFRSDQRFTISFHPEEKQGNWSWQMGDGEVQFLSIDFLRSMAIFKANRLFWKMLVTALFHKETIYGRHLTGKEHLEKKIALNFFGYANVVRCDEAVLQALCPVHVGAEECQTCLQCGAPYDEDEEEENEADYCICGFSEDECKCVPCHNCGEKKDCTCVICDEDDCNLCTCKDEDHIDYHHRPCDCELPCTPEQRQPKHPIRSCPGHTYACEDCGQNPCRCSNSKSQSYEYSFGN